MHTLAHKLKLPPTPPSLRIDIRSAVECNVCGPRFKNITS